MMIPKGKLLALLLVFTAVGGVAATGAFTTVQADRTASVSTTGDSNALLQIEEDTDSPFSTTDNGEVALNFNDNDASGVNLDSETLDDEVIEITNNGDESVTISASTETASGATIKFYVLGSDVTVDDSGSSITLSNDNEVPTGDSITRYVVDDQANGVTLGSGDSVTLGLYVSVTDSTSGELFTTGSDPVEITADATTSETALSKGT